MPDNEEVAGNQTKDPAAGAPPRHTLAVRLLGPFSVSYDGRAAGPWPRPSARRLCELVLVSPGRRVTRDLACEELFGDLDPRAAARAVSKALSMARAALAGLAEPGLALLEADLNHIWAAPSVLVDADVHEAALRAALAVAPGQDRDDMLSTALAEDGELLADEPYADWAMRPRERLETLRQQARLALARDRSRGAGQASPAAVMTAWEACFEHDPASEEAAIALVRGYLAQGRREFAVRVYERCAAAVSELGLRVSAALEEAFAAPAPAVVAAALPPEELRTVSILAADLTVPAAQAAELGLEHLREVVAGSLAAVIAEVEELGGTVTSVSGGGLQAVFGAPEAHEDDPERAVRAAFRALGAVASLSRGRPSPLRVGIETGQAVLGPIGGGGKVEYAAVGEVVSTAAALQSAARAGSALIGPVTRAAAGHLFTWDGGEQVLTGPVSGPVTASYLGGPRPGATARPPGLGGRGPLVGRQDELAVLDAALRDALSGRGSVVVITAEPGLGKTRLVKECHGRLAAGRPPAGRLPVGRPPASRPRAGRVRWLEGRCASYASSTPYSLYRQLLANISGVTPDLPDAVVRPAVERALTRVTGSADLFPPLARMMGLSSGAALGRLSPEETHRATFAAWRSLVTHLARTAPTVLVLEDLHWADPTSQHLTGHLAALAAGRPLLVILTTRPEGGDFEEFLQAEHQVHRITLGRLSAAAERSLARSLIGAEPGAGPGSEPGPEILDSVLASVDGNPLFLEERLSSLLETKALVHDRGTWQLSEAARQEVPQALERLVRSRVDRLSAAAREVVRHAAVLGLEFPLSLLAAVCAADQPAGPALDKALDELRAKDFLRDVAGLPEPAFRFRHALIQEATYQGLLGSERRLLHGRAAWALEAASRARLDEVAAVLGRHFAAAGEHDRALAYLTLAGDHATSAFANNEAISSYRAALAITAEQSGSDADAAVDLLAKLANVLWRTGRRGEAAEAFREALDLAEDTNPLRRAHLQIRLGRLEMADGRYEAAAAAFDAAEALLPDSPDDAVTEEWLELMVDGRGGMYTMREEPERVLDIFGPVRAVLDSHGSPARKFSFYMHLTYARVMLNGYRVDDTDIADMHAALDAARQGDEEKDTGYGLFWLGRLHWLRGDLAEAKDLMEQSLAMGERIGESILLGQSVLGLALIGLRRGDAAAVREFAARAAAAAGQMISTDYDLGILGCQVWLAWRDGRAADVLALAKEVAQVRAASHAPGSRHLWVYLWPLLAVHLAAGRLADAAAAAAELLHPGQQRLPESLESALRAAVRAWHQNEPEPAAAALAEALAQARALRYC